MKTLKNTLFTLILGLFTQGALGMEQPLQPPKFAQEVLQPSPTLELLPMEIKRKILRINADASPVLNIPRTAKGILALAGTSKALRASMNTPQNLLAFLRSLPTNAAALYLAEKLEKMPGMQTKEVQEWLEAIKSQPFTNGNDLLYSATVDDKEKVIQLLQEKNIDLNYKKINSAEGKIPLTKVAGLGRIEMVKLLLAAGANPNICNYFGVSALGSAVYDNFPDHIKVIMMLLRAGANPNLKAKQDGSTALILATQASNITAV